MPTATSDHRHQLEAQGFTVLRGVLPPDLLATTQQVLECWVEEMIARWQREGLLAAAPDEQRFRQRLLVAWRAAGQPHHERSPRGQLVSLAPERLFRVLTHPALLDVAVDLLGTDRLISHEVWNSRPKAPDQRFTDTPWHQDAQYFRDQAERRMVNLWWPLHRVDATSSCLAMAPDIHRGGEVFESLQHETGFLVMPTAVTERLTEVPIELEAGDLVAFTNRTPHRALPNRGDAIRWSMDLRFAVHGDEDRWPLGNGIVARHPDAGQLTGFDHWLASWR